MEKEKKNYGRAVRRASAAAKAGKHPEDVEEVFKIAMQADSNDLESIPKDEAHARYLTAMLHVKALKDMGKSPEEIHSAFMKIMGDKGPLKK